jgi:hypothetical protein
MRRILIAAVAVLAFTAARADSYRVLSATVDGMPTISTPAPMPTFRLAESKPTPPEVPTPLPQIMVAPQNYDEVPPVVTVSQPKPTVLLGDYAGAALEWMLPILAPVIAGFLVDALIKLRQRLGQSTSEAQRDKLQQMAENAVNLAGHQLNHDLSGKLPMPARNEVMAMAVDYVQAHGSDTIKALGLDPTDPKAVEAIKGRIATIMANKSSPPVPTAVVVAK